MVQPVLENRVELIRFADDAILIFRSERDAQRVYRVIEKRFQKYGLEVHPEKTSLKKFHKPDDKKPKSGSNHVNFLGFTHYWGKSRNNRWVVKRKTQKERLRVALKKIASWCKKNRHEKLSEQWKMLSQKVRGHYGYYGITGNILGLKKFLVNVKDIWIKWLNRRDRSYCITRKIRNKILAKYPLPAVKIVHSVL